MSVHLPRLACPGALASYPEMFSSVPLFVGITMTPVDGLESQHDYDEDTMRSAFRWVMDLTDPLDSDPPPNFDLAHEKRICAVGLVVVPCQISWYNIGPFGIVLRSKATTVSVTATFTVFFRAPLLAVEPAKQRISARGWKTIYKSSQACSEPYGEIAYHTITTSPEYAADFLEILSILATYIWGPALDSFTGVKEWYKLRQDITRLSGGVLA